MWHDTVDDYVRKTRSHRLDEFGKVSEVESRDGERKKTTVEERV